MSQPRQGGERGLGRRPEVPGERHRILHKELTSDPNPLLQRTPPGHSSNWRAVQPALRRGCGRPCSQHGEYVPSGAHASRLTHTDVYLPALFPPAETTHPLHVFPSPPRLTTSSQQGTPAREGPQSLPQGVGAGLVLRWHCCPVGAGLCTAGRPAAPLTSGHWMLAATRPHVGRPETPADAAQGLGTHWHLLAGQLGASGRRGGRDGPFHIPGALCQGGEPSRKGRSGQGGGGGDTGRPVRLPDCASLSLPALGESLHSPLREGVDCCFRSQQLKQSWLPRAAGSVRVGVFPATTPPA